MWGVAAVWAELTCRADTAPTPTPAPLGKVTMWCDTCETFGNYEVDDAACWLCAGPVTPKRVTFNSAGPGVLTTDIREAVCQD